MKAKTWLFGVAILGAAVVSGASCALSDYQPPPAAGASGGAGGVDGVGGMGGAGGIGTTGAAGGPTTGTGGGMGGIGGGNVASSSSASVSASSGAGECILDEDCRVGDPCVAASCVAGSCAYALISNMDDVKPDAVGDCQSWHCVDGKLLPSPNPNDPPQYADECYQGSCIASGPLTIVPVGSTCTGGFCATDNGGKAGVCVACTLGNGCGLMETCQLGKCRPPHCGDGVFDPMLEETGTDCGGGCVPCADGVHCDGNGDCSSGVCVAVGADPAVCAQRTCSDKVKNGNEADVDCGGGGCMACADEKHCLTNDHCASGVCYQNKCRAATCKDNRKNGSETGVDCGGLCLPCP